MRCIIVLPCYSEEENLHPLIQRISACLDNLYEIIAVDDGSRDGTLPTLEKLRLKYPLKIVKHRYNMGFSRAVESGLRAVLKYAEETDAIVTMDADMTHDPCLIPRMLQRIDQGFDLVIASRYVKDGTQTGLGIIRNFLSRGANLVVGLLFDRRIKDATSGFRCWRTRLLKKVLQRYGDEFLRSRGFEATLELLIKAVKLDAKVTEIPVCIHYERKRGKSKMRLMTTMVSYIVLMIFWLKSNLREP